ncbi:VCBS protein [marine gamma proteobacterium HTCC2080]|nr:VCBS protein [marine gamma proteobacterium HTCC2080]
MRAVSLFTCQYGIPSLACSAKRFADSQRLPLGALTGLLLLLARHRGYERVTLLSSSQSFSLVKLMRLLAGLFLIFGVVGTALADPIKWNIPTSTLTPEVTNTGPSTISGTFVYDADSNTTSEVNVNITIDGDAYALTASGLNSNGYVRLMAANQVGAVGAYVEVTNLTNAGGSITESRIGVIGVGECTELSDQLCSNVSPQAFLSNPITLTSVPQAPGDLDTSFPARALNDAVDTVLELSNGQYLIGGTFTDVDGIATRDKLIRLNTNGTLDESFTPPKDLNLSVWSVAELSNGQYLIGGSFTDVDGIATRDKLIRLNTNGSLDESFTPPKDLNGTVHSLAELSNGKYLIGGAFRNVGGDTTRDRLMRLNIDGSLDESFTPPKDLNDSVWSVAELSNGQYLIGGSFTDVDGIATRDKLIRLNTNGTLDESFTPPKDLNLGVWSVAELSNGQYLIGGSFTDVDGIATRDKLIRLNTNGTLDTSFTPPEDLSSTVYKVSELRNGQYLIGGSFSNVGGDATLGSLIRLDTGGSLDTRFTLPETLVGGNAQSVFWFVEASDGTYLVGGKLEDVGGDPTRDNLIRLLAEPQPPTSVTTTNGESSLLVSWSAPTANDGSIADGGSSITGYTATAAPGGATCTITPPSPTGTSCTITGLTNGTDYTVTVTAGNIRGNSGASLASAATAAGPNYSVTASGGANGTIIQDGERSVAQNQTAVFVVTPDAGYTATVAGTCGGTLDNRIYRTNPVTSDCTVVATFTQTGCPTEPVLNTLTLEQQIQLVYVGLLKRGADRDGLAYWINDIQSGFTIEKLRENVVNSQPEYLQDLGLLTRANLVPRFYQNLFSRTPPTDDTGLAYWLSGGGATVKIDKLVLALINGAGCTDAKTLVNKATVAAYYTNNYTTYVKAEAIEAVANVDSTDASVTAAKTYVDGLSNG